MFEVDPGLGPVESPEQGYLDEEPLESCRPTPAPRTKVLWEMESDEVTYLFSVFCDFCVPSFFLQRGRNVTWNEALNFVDSSGHLWLQA